MVRWRARQQVDSGGQILSKGFATHQGRSTTTHPVKEVRDCDSSRGRSYLKALLPPLNKINDTLEEFMKDATRNEDLSNYTFCLAPFIYPPTSFCYAFR